MPYRRLLRFLATALIYGVAVLGIAILFVGDSGVLKVGGVALLGAFVMLRAAQDWFEAHENERHVENFPELLRNDPRGKRVIAAGDFTDGDGGAVGSVSFRGEQWRARCVTSDVPRDREALRVCGRDGLTLLVTPPLEDAE